MKFQAGPNPLSETYDIRFRYETCLDSTVLTSCIVSYVDPHVASGPEKYREISRGSALQSPRDTFRKDTGRKIALARAMTGWPKASRKAAWRAYLSRGRVNLALTS